MNVAADEPSRLADVSNLFPPFGELPLEFTLLDKTVPHFQVATPVGPGSSVETLTKSVAVDSVFRTFIHTKYNRVRVTALPTMLRPQGGNTPIRDKAVTLDVKRADVLKLLKRHVGISSFDELVGAQFLGEYDPDEYNDAAWRCLTDDEGPPTVHKFFRDLKAIAVKQTDPGRQLKVKVDDGAPNGGEVAMKEWATIEPLLEDGLTIADRAKLKEFASNYKGTKEAKLATDELNADAKLRIGKQLLKRGRTKPANDIFREVVDAWPATQTAIQAKRILQN